MSKFTGTYPKNLVIQGVLSFPLTSDADLAALKEWRVERKISKPQYPDKIGASLLLDQAGLDKAVTYLTDVYLPFNDVLYADTDGEKGIPPELSAELLKQAKTRDWSDSNMPIRALTAKDIENRPSEDLIAKIKFSGPYESDMGKKALIKDGDDIVAVKLEDVDLPESRKDYNQLWWGAGWNFRVGLRFNAFDTASVGVTAYGTTLYLLPHLGLPVNGGGDTDVLNDGDDWE